MSPLIYYNIFICWVVTVFALITGRFVIKEGKARYDRSFGLFWIFFGVVWFFVGLSLLAWRLGYPTLSRYFFYIDQVFVPLHILFVADYMVGVTINKKIISNILAAFNTLVAVLFLASTIAIGPATMSVSDWTIKYQPPKFVVWLIIALVIEGAILLALDLAKNSYYYFKQKKKNYLARLLIDFSVIIYIAAGAIDESGEVSGWPLLALRMIILIAAMFGYVAYSALEDYHSRRLFKI